MFSISKKSNLPIALVAALTLAGGVGVASANDMSHDKNMSNDSDSAMQSHKMGHDSMKSDHMKADIKRLQADIERLQKEIDAMKSGHRKSGSAGGKAVKSNSGM